MGSSKRSFAMLANTLLLGSSFPTTIGGGGEFQISDKVGNSLKLICNTNEDFSSCIFFSPQKEKFDIGTDGGEGFSNPRVHEDSNPSRTCGIHINQVAAEDEGVWRCEVQFERINRVATANASQYVHVHGGEVVNPGQGHQLFPVAAVLSSTHMCIGCSGGPAKFCIDSNVSTLCHSKHFADKAPWIAVRFSEPVTVTGVEFVNAKAYWDRVGPVEVRVTNTLPKDGTTMFSDGELFGNFKPGNNNRLEGNPVKGKVVLVQRLPGQYPNDVLIMEEIRVFGFTEGHQLFPVAAVLSSTHMCIGCSGGPAKFCIDSDISTLCHSKHFADKAPWIAVRFSEPVTVTGVEFVNAKAYWDRVGPVEVRVTNTLPKDGTTMF